MSRSNRFVRRVAVLGAGRMGAQIACHFANVGLDVLLLDVASSGTTRRNDVGNKQLQAAIQSHPPPLYDASFRSQITVGNFEDDLPEVGTCDWVLEAVVEDVAIKQALFAKVDALRKENCLVTSNTSSIPLHVLSSGRSASFCAHFCGTHFFNPPRYLRLLEIIPTAETASSVVDFLIRYGRIILGKEAILCKDTPAFVANRIGIYGILSVIRAAEDLGFSFAEVDALTGPLIGRPKSATFRTLDVVGVDVVAKVIRFLHESLKDDPRRACFALPSLVSSMDKKKLWGEKTQQGFYKKVKKDGVTEILQLDPSTHTYQPYEKPHFEALLKARGMEALPERFAFLLTLSDRVGDFYRRTTHEVFAYAAACIPEIADAPHIIDSALRAGFGWAMGPFQLWDALGFEATAVSVEKGGEKCPAWVSALRKKKAPRLYAYKDGKQVGYEPGRGVLSPIPGQEGVLVLSAHADKVVWRNRNVTLYDVGDGVLQMDFRAKMNTLNASVMEGVVKALELSSASFCGLVIASEEEHFSAGADLSLVYAHAAEQEYDEIDGLVRRFQQLVTSLRTAPIPVVVGIKGMTLGGGCELSVHADAIVASAESYVGLVETGVGLIPAGGGTKEMARRLSQTLREGDPVLNRLLQTFHTVATAKVSQSAHEALRFGYLRSSDTLLYGAPYLAQRAKEEALRLYRLGYTPGLPARNIKVQGRAGIAFLESVIANMRYGHYASAYDAKVAGKLSYVLNGGMLPKPTVVSEAYMMDLEREAFLSLCGEPKTLERMHGLLFKKKMVRN